MIISGIEYLCDNCLEKGPQVARQFQVATDDTDGLPLVAFRCMTCGELVEVCFVAGGTQQRRLPAKDPAFSAWLLTSYNVLLDKWSHTTDPAARDMFHGQMAAFCRVARWLLTGTDEQSGIITHEPLLRLQAGDTPKEADDGSL